VNLWRRAGDLPVTEQAVLTAGDEIAMLDRIDEPGAS